MEDQGQKAKDRKSKGKIMMMMMVMMMMMIGSIQWLGKMTTEEKETGEF